MTKIGWIGLGNMGTPMAQNLEKAGFPLTVYNRSADKTTPFAEHGTPVAQSLEELVQHVELIFTMVSNDQAVQSIYDEILLKNDISGKLFIDMSTISQALSMEIANKLAAKNAFFLDAPVAGSTQPAKEGTLIIMVGGDENQLNRALPYLEKLGKKVKYLGKNGQGIAAKLSINYFLSMIYLGLAETVLFAGEKGIDRADMLEIINESASGSGATKVKTPLLVNDQYEPPAFALDLMLKDILLAKANGADFPMTDSLIETYRQAADNGYGKADVIGIINFLKNR